MVDQRRDTALHATVAEYGGCIGLSCREDQVVRYGGSNVVFTNGGEDPWQGATELNSDESRNQLSLMADCADCGHCKDLHTPTDEDPAELNEVRKQVIDFLAKILDPAEVESQMAFLQ